MDCNRGRASIRLMTGAAGDDDDEMKLAGDCPLVCAACARNSTVSAAEGADGDANSEAKVAAACVRDPQAAAA